MVCKPKVCKVPLDIGIVPKASVVFLKINELNWSRHDDAGIIKY